MTDTFRLHTNNWPPCDNPANWSHYGDPRFKDWSQPYWEITVDDDGMVEITANRPTQQEVERGDLHGALGSTIHLKSVSKWPIKQALRFARRLCKADVRGLVVHPFEVSYVKFIETDIPIRYLPEEECGPFLGWPHPPVVARTLSAVAPPAIAASLLKSSVDDDFPKRVCEMGITELRERILTQRDYLRRCSCSLDGLYIPKDCDQSIDGHRLYDDIREIVIRLLKKIPTDPVQ